MSAAGYLAAVLWIMLATSATGCLVAVISARLHGASWVEALGLRTPPAEDPSSSPDASAETPASSTSGRRAA